jgi:hypothetical protein
MVDEGSLFTFFRWLGFVFVTIYVTITTAQSLWGWYVFLWQRDRYMNILRSYVIVHGLRLRMRSFGGDALVSVLLCVAFLLMWKAHSTLDAIGRVTRDTPSKIVKTSDAPRSTSNIQTSIDTKTPSESWALNAKR